LGAPCAVLARGAFDLGFHAFEFNLKSEISNQCCPIIS
jgi:hypothetical protein